MAVITLFLHSGLDRQRRGAGRLQTWPVGVL